MSYKNTQHLTKKGFVQTAGTLLLGGLLGAGLGAGLYSMSQKQDESNQQIPQRKGTQLVNQFMPMSEKHPYYLPQQDFKKAYINKLRKFYAKRLVQAYKKATGKTLTNPQAHVNPKINYIIGRAANVDKNILKKLDQQDRNFLGGWASSPYNISPDLIADAVDYYNEARGRHKSLQGDKSRQGPPLNLVVPD